MPGQGGDGTGAYPGSAANTQRMEVSYIAGLHLYVQGFCVFLQLLANYWGLKGIKACCYWKLSDACGAVTVPVLRLTNSYYITFIC